MPKTNTGIKHPKPRALRRKNINRKYSDYKGIRKLINDAMLELDKEDYEILYELYFKHTSVHQLGRSLGITCKAVRYRRARALERLKEIIKKREIDKFVK